MTCVYFWRKIYIILFIRTIFIFCELQIVLWEVAGINALWRCSIIKNHAYMPLSPETLYSNSALLVLKGTSWSNVKEELHNRFNLISEERVKFFKHNSENLMKIGWKIRTLWHFEVSQICTKHFLTSRSEKISNFSYENVRLALIPLLIDAE